MLLSAVLGPENTDINQEQETVHTLEQVEEWGSPKKGLCPSRGPRRETTVLCAVPHTPSLLCSQNTYDSQTRIRTTELQSQF